MDPYQLLKTRSNELIAKYIEPTIAAERKATEEFQPLPPVDFDSFAAFRLLSHAELEGYFERKAELALAELDKQIQAGHPISEKVAALIFLFIWKQRVVPRWSSRAGSDGATKKLEDSDFKNFAQQAVGFGRQFIKENNGIKENSIQMLSALMGYFSDELDDVLVNELNLYGKGRGDVAHDSWTKNTRIFTSAEDEKNRLQLILTLTEKFYEEGRRPQSKKSTVKGFFNALAQIVRPH